MTSSIQQRLAAGAIIIAGWTLGWSIAAGGSTLFLTIRLLLSGYFLLTGIVHLATLRRFTAIYRTTNYIAQRNKTYAYVTPLLEIVIGAGIFLNAAPVIAYVLAIAVATGNAAGARQSWLQQSIYGAVALIALATLTYLYVRLYW